MVKDHSYHSSRDHWDNSKNYSTINKHTQIKEEKAQVFSIEKVGQVFVISSVTKPLPFVLKSTVLTQKYYSKFTEMA